MSGYLLKGTCYPSLSDARQSACNDYPLIWGSGNNARSLTCSPSIDLTAAQMTMCRSTDGGACTTQSQPWPYMAECAYSGGSDLALDWGVVSITLFVTIWAGKQLIRLFEHHHTAE